MFTIDLLKGQGLPTRSRASNSILAATACAVPLLGALVVAGAYLQNRVVLSIQRSTLNAGKLKIEQLAGAVRQQRMLESQRAACRECLSEVSSVLADHTQWSPVLKAVVETLPDSVVLTAMEVRQRSVRRTIPRADDPKKTDDVTLVVPTLRMQVAAIPESSGNEAIRLFMDELRCSPAIGSKIEDITVSQRAESLEDLAVVAYEIDCLFKPRL